MRHFYFLMILVFLTGCKPLKPSQYGVFPAEAGYRKYIAAYDRSLKKLWKVPFEEKDVQTTFGIAHVIISGPEKAPPMVLLHGTDASSTMWYPNIKAFSAKYRVYAIDFPFEAGKSKANCSNMGNADVVTFYNDIFDYFNLENINLVAASRGGWIATYLALKKDSKIKKMALLSPAQTFSGVDKKGKALSAMGLKLFPNKRRLDLFFKNFSYFPDKIAKEYKEQFYLANEFGRSKPGLTKMMRFSQNDLKTLKLPVLVLIGDHDIINTGESLEIARKLLPQAQTALIRDAGHFISVDQSEIINKKVLEFLSQE